MKILDRFLDHITMYRLVLWHLVALLAAAFVLSLFGIVPHNPVAIAFSAAVILAVCWVTNLVFARVFEVPANRESVYITALILALIMDPVAYTDLRGIGGLIFASVWAMASKFIFAVGRKHVFNPAAFGVVLPAFLLDQPATWWVGGNLPLLPVVLIGGILIVRKLRRFDMVATFVAVALATILATTAPSQYAMALAETLKSSPIFFFAFVMLTEPLTAPTMRVPRLIFAALVGFLFAPNIHIGSFYLTPELALLVGNLFAWAVSPKGHFVLTLERIERAAADTYDFIFSTPHKLAFQPGQYLEWTLGMDHADNRGNRRYFTVASAPTEDSVRLGVKFYGRSSAFKRALGDMEPGDTIHAGTTGGRLHPALQPRPQARLPRRRHRHHAVPQHAAISHRPRRGATDHGALWQRAPRGRRLSRRARRSRASARHPDDLRCRPWRRPRRIPRLHRRAPCEGRHPRLPGADVLHFRPTGHGAGAPPHPDAHGRAPHAHQGGFLSRLRLSRA